MPFWEEHKKILIVTGGFLVMLFLLWLFMLRGYAYEADNYRKDYEKKIKAMRAKFCPDNGQRVEILKLAFTKANKELEKSLAKLGDKLALKFKEPMIPRRQLSHRQLFVRNEYSKLKEYVIKQAESNRRIRLSENVDKLGMNIPNQYSESLDQDIEWLRQMAVIRRMFDILMRVHEEKDVIRKGKVTRNLVEISLIRPLAPDKTGSDTEKFIMEYPVDLEVVITLRGLMRLLRLCSTAESFHIVRSLTIQSDPANRDSTREKRKVTPTLGEKWYVHHYRVNLTLAAMSMIKEAEVEKPKNTTKAQPHATIIPH